MKIAKLFILVFFSMTTLFLLNCSNGMKEESNTSDGKNILNSEAARIGDELTKPDSAGSQIMLSDAEAVDYFAASWRVHFPLPDDSWGYTFKTNGNFTYSNRSREYLLKRYVLSGGEWRIRDLNIEVKITSYLTSDQDPIDDPLGFHFPTKSKYLKTIVNDYIWHQIGRTDQIVANKVKSGIEWPAFMPLKTILFDKVQENEERHFRYPSH